MTRRGEAGGGARPSGGARSALDATATAAQSALRARRRSEATCVFVDVVDWASLAACLSPEEAVSLLFRLFARFDALAAAHGALKVQHAGDRVRSLRRRANSHRVASLLPRD